MGSLNKCSFIGNAARDCEARSTASGMAVANVSIACNYRAGGEDAVEWVNLVFFDKLADVAREYITQGKQVYVDGRMQTRKWTDKDGAERYSTEIVVSNLVLIGPAEGGGRAQSDQPARRGAEPDQRGGREPPARGQTVGERSRARTAEYRNDAPAERSPPPRRQAPPGRAAPRSDTGFDGMDDDIPF